ncbi:hypothetical protein BU26DRAFT_31240 [Trematosphaeria pertusa]|uniref:Uncharacterized protein n=1 Tax=Trematosphaeria pertusa TaxID=390896 RepID=A0A6A6J4T6_9PLEO|nr:uncharacterized protein BU26DRAFT_31240 [Trematosphaeria pertusa]KAF2256880.1 hypothetical protein BU26DRAFT_31240 [Trematosphaeria pertusa]
MAQHQSQANKRGFLGIICHYCLAESLPTQSSLSYSKLSSECLHFSFRPATAQCGDPASKDKGSKRSLVNHNRCRCWYAKAPLWRRRTDGGKEYYTRGYVVERRGGAGCRGRESDLRVPGCSLQGWCQILRKFGQANQCSQNTQARIHASRGGEI